MQLLDLNNAAENGNLSIYGYDSEKFQFFKRFKLGVFTAYEKSPDDGSVKLVPVGGYFSLKSKDENQSISYFVQNEDFISYLLAFKDIIRSNLLERIELKSLFNNN